MLLCVKWHCWIVTSTSWSMYRKSMLILTKWFEFLFCFNSCHTNTCDFDILACTILQTWLVLFKEREKKKKKCGRKREKNGEKKRNGERGKEKQKGTEIVFSYFVHVWTIKSNHGGGGGVTYPVSVGLKLLSHYALRE